MKNQTETALLVLRPQPSVWRRRVLLWAHGLALVALWLAALPWWLAALGSGGLWLSAWMTWHKPLPLRSLQWGKGDLWQLEILQGRWVGARLNAHGCRSLPWWVFLDLRLDDGRRLGVSLLRDSLSKDEFRRLRARLKVEAGALQRNNGTI
jgi:hypothetical protein